MLTLGTGQAISLEVPDYGINIFASLNDADESPFTVGFTKNEAYIIVGAGGLTLDVEVLKLGGTRLGASVKTGVISVPYWKEGMPNPKCHFPEYGWLTGLDAKEQMMRQGMAFEDAEMFEQPVSLWGHFCSFVSSVGDWVSDAYHHVGHKICSSVGLGAVKTFVDLPGEDKICRHLAKGLAGLMDSLRTQPPPPEVMDYQKEKPACRPRPSGSAASLSAEHGVQGKCVSVLAGTGMDSVVELTTADEAAASDRMWIKESSVELVKQPPGFCYKAATAWYPYCACYCDPSTNRCRDNMPLENELSWCWLPNQYSDDYESCTEASNNGHPGTTKAGLDPFCSDMMARFPADKHSKCYSTCNPTDAMKKD